MTRKVSEWIADDDDQAIPARVKLRIFQKAEGKCAECGRELGGGIRAAYDHIQALINGGFHRESNLQLLCVSPCHAEKSKADVAEKAMIARKRKKHLGIVTPRKKIQSRGFQKSEPQCSASRPVEKR